MRPRLCCASRDTIALGPGNTAFRQSNTERHGVLTIRFTGRRDCSAMLSHSHIYLDIVAFGHVNNGTRS